MNVVQKILAFGCVAAGITAGCALAAESKTEARVTQIVRDVKLLPADASARPATLNDNVREDTGVRTGGDSRSELTFVDLTITRLGSNTIFSFNKAGRSVQLDSGSVLLRVPKDSGGGTVRGSAVTVAVTGTTVIFESTRAGKSKLIVLEGGARASLNKYRGQSQNVRAGQMLEVPAGATKMPLPTNVDLNQIMKTHPLITGFAPLPSRDLIYAAAQEPPPPEPRGPSVLPILPVIDLLGGFNRGPRGPRRNPPGNRPQPSAPPRTPSTGEGAGAGPNKGPVAPPPITRQAPGRTRVPPVTSNTPKPRQRIPKKTTQPNNGPR